MVSEPESNGNSPLRKYHFTLNDIHKAAQARDIILCMLIDDLSKLSEGSVEALMILNTVFFIFISTMMPSYAYKQLNQTTDRAILSRSQSVDQDHLFASESHNLLPAYLTPQYLRLPFTLVI